MKWGRRSHGQADGLRGRRRTLGSAWGDTQTGCAGRGLAAGHGRVAPPFCCTDRTSVPSGSVATGGGRALGTDARTTAGRGRHYDHCDLGRTGATRPLSATPAAVADDCDGREAPARRRRRRQFQGGARRRGGRSIGGTGGGGEGRAPVCIRGDSGASARGGGASDGTGMRVTTRETCRPGLMPPLPRPPVGRHQPATVHRHCGGRRHRRAAAAAARSTARVAAGGGRSGVGSPGVSGGFYFFVTLALPRHLGVACPEVLIALRAFFKGGGAAVPWSAIDLVQRIRIRERNVIPYLPVEARNRPVTSCSTFSL